jgi:3-hydroxyisobutyrate dehydrogenase-like beta-hydroxyacid dehydrogenase
MDRIGIVGVGLMGLGIASNVLKKGYRLGFLDHPGNQPTASLVEGGATRFSSARELASASDVVILVVTGAPQVEAVLAGPDGVIAGLRQGAVVIDCSTSLPETTRAMAALVEQAGAAMLDAPMTRTPKEAAEGRLNLLVGGDAALFEQMQPLLRAFAENITHAGGIGAGHALKLVHNYVSLGTIAVVAEAAAAAETAGIDPAVLVSVLAKGGGGGVALDRLTPFILGKDPSNLRFTVANAAKDIDYYASMATAQASAAGVATAIRDAYAGQVTAGEGGRFVPEMIDLLK